MVVVSPPDAATRTGARIRCQATTGCLSVIIVMQIVDAFLCRSPNRSVLSTGLLGNPLILWGVALEHG
jgi:hypothetical protein